MFVDLTHLENFRRNADKTQELVYDSETIHIPASSPYVVRLAEIPDNGSVQSRPVINGFTEIYDSTFGYIHPSNPHEFQINYQTGDVIFSIYDADSTVSIGYQKKGSLVNANHINILAEAVRLASNEDHTHDWTDIQGNLDITLLDHTHDWTDIQGEPEFAPIDHTHEIDMVVDWTNLINIPLVFSPVDHTHDWTDVQGEPDFALIDHTHDFTSGIQNVMWDDITGKPDAFPPADHTHDWTSIQGEPEFALLDHTHEIDMTVDQTDIQGEPDFALIDHTHEIDMTVDWTDILNIPLVFSPDDHTHDQTDIQGEPDFALIDHTHEIDMVVDWTNLINAPLAFPPIDHTHDQTSIQGEPEFALIDHTHDFTSGVQNIMWDDITGKPDVFPSSDHTHDWTSIQGEPDFALIDHTHDFTTGIQNVIQDDITGKPEAFLPIDHTHDWTDIQGEPEFSLIDHTHDFTSDIQNIMWDDITGKPEAFLPVDHTHDWTEIQGEPDFALIDHTHDFTTGIQNVMWDDITGRPEAFPPVDHTHDWTSIQGEPEFSLIDHVHDQTDIQGEPDFALIDHTHDFTSGIQNVMWDDITGRPEVFPSSDHTHDQTEIQGEPDFALLDHTHGWADIDGEPDFALTDHTHDQTDIDGEPSFAASYHIQDQTTISNVPATYTPSTHYHIHHDLSELSDDDHTQYYNQARGDARYVKFDTTLPNGAHHYYDLFAYSGGVNVTGTMKITMPVSYTNTMMNIKIVGYDYTANRGGQELNLSGYNYSTSSQWRSCTAKIDGSTPFSSVRFSHDGTNCCILLGDVNTVWMYPKIYIADFFAFNVSVSNIQQGTGQSITPITDENGIKNDVSITTINVTGDHGSLIGLSDDDHTQYLNTTRHDTILRHGSDVVDHGLIAGLDDDDHSQYYNQARGDARYAQINHNQDQTTITNAPSTFVPSAHDHTTYELLSNKGAVNGYASLDAAGKIPIAQLPNSIMEYQGTWAASTNSPTLINGTGNAGDVYRVSVGGWCDFNGDTSIYFNVGDYVIYNGSTWEKSSAADGVESVDGQVGIIDLSGKYAPLSKGVTGGDAHNHDGTNGAQLDHGVMLGLSDDDHTQYYDKTRGDARYVQFDTKLSSGSHHYYDVASFNGGGAGLIGTMKITMPVSWNNTMMNIKITGYDYTANRGGQELNLSGYNYSTSSQWRSCTAKINGTAPFSSVRFCHDGTNCCVLLGTTSNVQMYPKIVVTDFIAGGGAVSSSVQKDGWLINLITDESGITSSASIDLVSEDHGSLTGLSDDDHTQYLNTTRHDTISRHGSSVVDHGQIGGLSDDDHTQYLNTTRHDATERHGSGVVDHGQIGGLEDDDHTQYYNQTRGDARYIQRNEAIDADTLDGTHADGFVKLNEFLNSKPTANSIHQRDVFSYNEIGTITGTMKISLPPLVGSSNVMIQLKIDGYNYGTSGTSSPQNLELGGYVQATNTQNRTGVIMFGTSRFTLVRLGHDGTSHCILLGDTSTSQVYPRFTITNVITSYSGSLVTSFDRSNWSASIITNEAGITVSSTPPVNSDVDADTLDGNHAADFAAFSHTHDWSDITNPPSSSTSAGGFIKSTVLTSTTETVFRTQSDTTSVQMRMVGGGGSGGGAYKTTDGMSGGSGGGGGGYVEKQIIVAGNTDYTYKCGAGGTAVVGAENGATGGDSTITIDGTVYKATGGSGGGFVSDSNATAIRLGGAGGVGYNGDINIQGECGGTLFIFGPLVGISGQGGSSRLGSGAIGRLPSGDGNSGTDYGSGGSGALAKSSITTSKTSGAGFQGVIIIFEYK